MQAPDPADRAAPAASTGPDDSVLLAAARQRLHPLSWLFVLLRQLRNFGLPIVLLLFTGRGEQNPADWIAVFGACGLALVAVWQYYTYRYGFLEHALVIRSGLLQRNLRLIPFDRVQNVVLQQNLLHRLAGVATLRLESAGGGAGGEPEAEMQVLRLAEAHAVEARVRAGATRSLGAMPRPAEGSDATPPPPWLELPTSELVRLGLISNRGMLVVAAAFALLSQAGGEAMQYFVDQTTGLIRLGLTHAEVWHLGPPAYAVLGLALLLALLAVVRLLSVSLAILQFHGFRLAQADRELRVERGLLSRVRGHLPMRRIQSYTLTESLLHRGFGRQSLRIDQASSVGGANSEAHSLRDLLPIARPPTLEAVLVRLLGPGRWPLEGWRPLHPRAWWRVFAPWAGLLLVVTAVWVGAAGLQGLWVLLALPFAAWRARLWARYSAYALHRGVICFRQGWWSRHWRFAEVRKLQALRLEQGPIDRRHGMATLLLDTIGATATEPALRIPFLPLAEALALAERLRAQMPRELASLSPARTAESAARAG